MAHCPPLWPGVARTHDQTPLLDPSPDAWQLSRSRMASAATKLFGSTSRERIVDHARAPVVPAHGPQSYKMWLGQRILFSYSLAYLPWCLPSLSPLSTSIHFSCSQPCPLSDERSQLSRRWSNPSTRITIPMPRMGGRHATDPPQRIQSPQRHTSTVISRRPKEGQTVTFARYALPRRLIADPHLYFRLPTR